MKEQIRLLLVGLLVMVLVCLLGGRALAQPAPRPAATLPPPVLPAAGAKPPQAPPTDDRMVELEKQVAELRGASADHAKRLAALEAAKTAAAAPVAAVPLTAPGQPMVATPAVVRARSVPGIGRVMVSGRQQVGDPCSIRFADGRTVTVAVGADWGDLDNNPVDPTPGPSPTPDITPNPGRCVGGACGAGGFGLINGGGGRVGLFGGRWR